MSTKRRQQLLEDPDELALEDERDDPDLEDLDEDEEREANDDADPDDR